MPDTPGSDTGPLDARIRKLLLDLARDSVRHRLHCGTNYDVEVTQYPPSLQHKQSSFVTLQLDGRLRGCIGSLSALRALVEDVASNAAAAAFEDPRFAPLSAGEFEQLEFHISVLSSPRPLPFHSRSELARALRPGIDGVVLEENGQRATFLPAVWEQLPDPELFLAHLRTKAGLDSLGWSEHTRVSLYTVEDFSCRD